MLYVPIGLRKRQFDHLAIHASIPTAFLGDSAAAREGPVAHEHTV